MGLLTPKNKLDTILNLGPTCTLSSVFSSTVDRDKHSPHHLQVKRMSVSSYSCREVSTCSQVSTAGLYAELYSLVSGRRIPLDPIQGF